MKQIHVRIRRIVEEKRIPDSVKSQLLHHYCEAYDARGDRFDIIGQPLPWFVWPLLIIVSLTWLWGFVWLTVGTQALKIYMSVGVLGLVSLLYSIARGLDSLRSFRPRFAPFENKEFQYSAYRKG